MTDDAKSPGAIPGFFVAHSGQNLTIPGEKEPGPQRWLANAASGKVDRKGNHERAKAAYLAKRGPL
jgi:hypothetical protein